MNTPTPTPRTDAATYPADCLGATLVTNRDLARALETELAALRAERDQLRDQLAAARQMETVAIASWDEERARALREGARVVEWRDRAERAEADLAIEREKAERYRLVTLKLDADLAAERARLDWVFRNCKVTADGYPIHDREDLGVAMKEDAK